MQEGSHLLLKKNSFSNQLPPLSGHRKPYSSASFVVATGGNKRPATSLMFTLILQLELKSVMYVHLMCLLCFDV